MNTSKSYIRNDRHIKNHNKIQNITFLRVALLLFCNLLHKNSNRRIQWSPGFLLKDLKQD